MFLFGLGVFYFFKIMGKLGIIKFMQLLKKQKD